MRIGLVYQTFNLSGSLPRAHVELTRYLLRAGHEVHVFSAGRATDRSLAPDAVFHEVSAVKPSGRYGAAANALSFAWNSTRTMSGEQPPLEVIHGRGMSAFAQDILHLPGVWHGDREHGLAARTEEGLVRRLKDLAGPVVRPLDPVRRFLEWNALRNPRVVRLHVDSRIVRDDLLKHYTVDPAKIVVVPTGVNLDEFQPADDRASVRRSLDLPEQGTTVLFCGHDFARKGLDRAILALSRMREPARLVVVGGRDPSGYAELARESGVGDRVLFVGGRTDTALFYRAADIVVLPTRADMWGAPAIEAMASGVPIVVSNAAGASDAVVEGETGYVLPEPLETDAVAAALDRLAADPDLRARMGARGREVSRLYTWDRHGEKVESEMLAVVESRAAAGGH